MIFIPAVHVFLLIVSLIFLIVGIKVLDNGVQLFKQVLKEAVLLVLWNLRAPIELVLVLQFVQFLRVFLVRDKERSFTILVQNKR